MKKNAIVYIFCLPNFFIARSLEAKKSKKTESQQIKWSSTLKIEK